VTSAVVSHCLVCSPAITITASGPAGAFYATQTLLSMTEGKGEARSLVLPVCEIKVPSERYDML